MWAIKNMTPVISTHFIFEQVGRKWLHRFKDVGRYQQ